jgi:hypothetical protein
LLTPHRCVRETIIGIITIHLPILKPLFNKSFWSTDSFKSTSISHGTSRNLEPGGTYEMTSSHTSKNKNGKNWDMEPAMGRQKSSSHSKESLGSLAGSDDFIIDGKREGVTVETTYQVTTEDIEKGDGIDDGWRYGGMGGGASKASVRAHPSNE